MRHFQPCFLTVLRLARDYVIAEVSCLFSVHCACVLCALCLCPLFPHYLDNPFLQLSQALGRCQKEGRSRNDVVANVCGDEDIGDDDECWSVRRLNIFQGSPRIWFDNAVNSHTTACTSLGSRRGLTVAPWLCVFFPGWEGRGGG